MCALEKMNQSSKKVFLSGEDENSLHAQREFTQGVLSEISLGLWSFEIDEGVPPRMYGNREMDALIGCDGGAITPEEYYNVWHGRVDKDHLHAVTEVVSRIVAGEFAEVSYPYHHPERGVIQVVCGGRRDYSYSKGLRIVGRHQEITNLINLHAGERELEVIATKASDAKDLAEKVLCINESLSVLTLERDFGTALLKIMDSWCGALKAQWCCVGRWDGDSYHIVQSYAAPGEQLAYEPGCTVERIKAFCEDPAYHGAHDYVAMPDFQLLPIFSDFLRTSSNTEVLGKVTSYYSHVIRFNGRPWGTLALLFRNRHELTRNEVVFLKAAVRGIELSLIRQDYEEEIAAERERELAVEQDRADKERRINESLSLLVRESNLTTALDRIMSIWCEGLKAQWCQLGHWRGDDYEVVHSFASSGIHPIVHSGTVVGGMRKVEQECGLDVSSDYIPMPSCAGNRIVDWFAKVSVHPEEVKTISSYYSHVIRFRGEEWGRLTLFFQQPHVFTPNEEAFFKAAVKSVELSLEHDYTFSEVKSERDRALAAERARSLFFSSVSHDIRTPLNAIVGFSELLERGVTDQEEHDRYVSSIRSSGKVLARLVNDILDLSKLESGKMELINEATDIPSLVREVAEALRLARGRKEITFVSEIAPMPTVVVDPQRIRQFLYNLLSNAYKYTAQGSILLKTTWTDQTLTLAVTDTGKGIAPEDVARISQPFVQLADRNHRDGTGLGLSICQRLANLMGGELIIESELGKGSTFKIVLPNLPIAALDSVAKEIHDASANAPVDKAEPAHEYRILAVDDSPVNLMVVKSMLRRCGVENVVTAPDGQAAFDLLSADSNFDFVLSDLWMPRMDGETLVRLIRATPALAHLPVYAVTADVEALKTSAEQGFTGVLLKPLTIKDVSKLIKR